MIADTDPVSAICRDDVVGDYRFLGELTADPVCRVAGRSPEQSHPDIVMVDNRTCGAANDKHAISFVVPNDIQLDRVVRRVVQEDTILAVTQQITAADGSTDFVGADGVESRLCPLD